LSVKLALPRFACFMPEGWHENKPLQTPYRNNNMKQITEYKPFMEKGIPAKTTPGFRQYRKNSMNDENGQSTRNRTGK